MLFDIDGTLLAGANRLHTAAFAMALQDRYGTPDPFVADGDWITCGGRPLAGHLDADIARWCLETARPEGADDDELGLYCELITARYLAAVDAQGVGAIVLPGVHDVLAQLGAAGVGCGVITGNLEPIAARKLTDTGL